MLKYLLAITAGVQIWLSSDLFHCLSDKRRNHFCLFWHFPVLRACLWVANFASSHRSQTQNWQQIWERMVCVYDEGVRDNRCECCGSTVVGCFCFDMSTSPVSFCCCCCCCCAVNLILASFSRGSSAFFQLTIESLHSLACSLFN